MTELLNSNASKVLKPDSVRLTPFEVGHDANGIVDQHVDPVSGVIEKVSHLLLLRRQQLPVAGPPAQLLDGQVDAAHRSVSCLMARQTLHVSARPEATGHTGHGPGWPAEHNQLEPKKWLHLWDGAEASLI